MILKCSIIYLLDNATSHEALVNGLRELSPLTDDALKIAEQMSDQDFYDFKIALAHERGLSMHGEVGSKLPKKYLALVLPRRLIAATELAQKAQAPLGAVIIRMMELEEESGGSLKPTLEKPSTGPHPSQF